MSLQVSELEEIKGQLAALDPSNAQEFKASMVAACSQGAVSFDEYGQKNLVNPITVDRWEKGEAAPSVVRRKLLIKEAKSQLERKIKTFS